jgi:hypothetical protein
MGRVQQMGVILTLEQEQGGHRPNYQCKLPGQAQQPQQLRLVANLLAALYRPW